MKLIFKDGPVPVEDTELKEPFLCLGREVDNDIRLKSPEASRYHAKITKDGNIWIVEDLESSNGVLINNHKIDQSAPLAHGDEVKIGDFVFKVQDQIDTPAPVADFTKTKVEMDKKGDDNKESGHTKVLALGFVFMLLLVIIGLTFISLKESGPPPKTPEQIAEEKLKKLLRLPFSVEYEFLSSEKDPMLQKFNIFTYRVQIEENEMAVKVINLQDQLKQEEVVTLSDEQVSRLKDFTKTPAFLDASSSSRKSQNKLEKQSLFMRLGYLGNQVIYENDNYSKPPIVEDIIAYIDTIVDDVTQVNRIPRAVAFERAEELYIAGKRLLEYKAVELRNEYDGLNKLDSSIKYLTGFQNLPPYYTEAGRILNKGRASFQARIDRLFNEGSFHERSANLDEASKVYLEIIERIPDETNPMYRTARQKYERVKNKLESIKKK
ncbi:MAG: FHA domain-containing protein [Lentisphaeria bacterium]|nr:FHA domain-containing protein [Lentisphaeria bacterium]